MSNAQQIGTTRTGQVVEVRNICGGHKVFVGGKPVGVLHSELDEAEAAAYYEAQ